LAQAQKRTEERMDQLIQAQIKTEERLNRLEVVVDRLVGELKIVRKEVGGLSHAVGYRLEDEAIWALPALLERDHAIRVEGELRRDFLSLPDRKPVEINILGEGTRQGRLITIMGEAKTQLKKRDVDQFISLVTLIGATHKQPIVPLLITYQTSASVKQYTIEKGAILYFSYQLRPPSHGS